MLVRQISSLGVLLLLLLLKGIYCYPHLEGFFGNNTCTLRYQFLHHAKEYINCTRLKEINDVCRYNITVYYKELPPYSYTEIDPELNVTSITGILPGMLKMILFDGCCLGCNQGNYILTNKTNEELFHMRLEDNEIIIPIENARTSNQFGPNNFVALLDFNSVSFIGKLTKPSPTDLMEKLIESTKKTWPLFIIALSLAICAGSIVWVLDTWFNKKQFPRRFPRGLFEGFWWAYISMTTVGYGDRTPHSVMAKLFAVFWIMIGITIFNMYTAAITSVLTAELARELQRSVYMKKVGILNTSIASYSGAVAAYATIKEYGSIQELREGLKRSQVQAISLENYMAFHYHDDILQSDTKISFLSQQAINKNVLGITTSAKIGRLINSFVDNNEDSMDVIKSKVLKKVMKNKFLVKDSLTEPFSVNTGDLRLPFTSKAPLFIYVLCGTLLTSIVLIVFGIITNRYRKKIVKSITSRKDEREMLKNKSNKRR